MRAHARQVQIAKQLRDAGLPIPDRHSALLDAWTRNTFDASQAGNPQSMFSLTRAYLGHYRGLDRPVTVEETQRFIERHPEWIQETFDIMPPQS
jgi:hypothetical protein